jgi:hypothetical protein
VQAVLGALEHLVRHGRDRRQEAVAVVLGRRQLVLAVQLLEPLLHQLGVVGQLLALHQVVEHLDVHVAHGRLVTGAAQASLQDREAGERDRRQRAIRRVDQEDLHRGAATRREMQCMACDVMRAVGDARETAPCNSIG